MKNFFRNKAFLAVAASSFVLSACGDPLGLHKDKEKLTAPQSESETGVMVMNASKDGLGALADEHSEMRFRRINEKHGLYEIYNLSQEDIARALPEADVHKNHYFYTFEEKQNEADWFEVLEEEVDASNTDQRLAKCADNNTSAPLANITTVSPSDELKNGVIELGQTFSLSNQGSEANSSHPSDLKSAWIVLPPEGSKLGETVVFDQKLEFKPDAYGLYNIMLVVQDDRAACGTATSTVTVTGNKSYTKDDAVIDESLKTIELAQFKHLKQMRIDESWDKSEGESITIAVVDSGVNYNHPALARNIATVEGEIPENGLDDDGNGFVDDYVGWDFSNNDAFPYDDQGHGSHVAGLAASELWGAARKAKVLPVKALGPGGGDIASIVGGILYAVDSGAQVINMSFGSYAMPHPKLVEAMDYAEEQDVLIIAASGNGHPMLGMGVNTDKMPNFPSALPNDNIVAVAASQADGRLTPYSNFGPNTVDVIALGGLDPDDLLMSCYLDNPAKIMLKGMSGTSMAAPLVSGIAAQILSLNPQLSSAEVREILMTSGPEADKLKKYIGSGRHVDALDALLLTQEGLPPALTSNSSLDEALRASAQDNIFSHSQPSLPTNQ